MQARTGETVKPGQFRIGQMCGIFGQDFTMAGCGRQPSLAFAEKQRFPTSR
jgi:hypothetical protein